MPDGTPIDLEKLRSISVGHRTRDRIKEWRSDDGERHKATTDELGNTVTKHAKGDRQDVLIRPTPINLKVLGE